MPSLLSLSITLILSYTLCRATEISSGCIPPLGVAPDFPPPAISDCRSLLAHIPFLPKHVFPYDRRFQSAALIPLRVMIRHDSCILKADFIQIGSAADARERVEPLPYPLKATWPFVNDVINPDDHEPMIFNFLRELRIVGDSIVTRCAKDGVRGWAMTMDVWGSRHINFRVMVGGAEGRQEQDAEIEALRRRIALGSGGGKAGSRANADGARPFARFYFDV